ncbi:MAG: YdcF family protein [Candidatus Thiodiazotropha sp. (ex. Lucinoma kazani)]
MQIISKLKMMGADGVFTLLISNIIILLSFGITLIPALNRITKVALNSSHDPPDCECCFVFGLKLIHDHATEEFVLRLQRAYSIYLNNPSVKILILGGTTPNNSVSEARKGGVWLVQQGVPEELIQIEDQSLNTLENLKNARDLLEGCKSQACFISNRYHLYRLSCLAKQMSIAHTLCAAEERWVYSTAMLKQLCVEAYFVHWFEVGRFLSYMTANQKSIERIS